MPRKPAQGDQTFSHPTERLAHKSMIVYELDLNQIDPNLLTELLSIK